MPIILPKNFKDDISETRDTAIFPVIVIGDVYDSANSLIFSKGIGISTRSDSIHAYGALPIYVRGILLSIPSVKEKINLSNKKYSINSISLNISNYSSGEKTFSQLYDPSKMFGGARVYLSTRIIHPFI